MEAVFGKISKQRPRFAYKYILNRICLHGSLQTFKLKTSGLVFILRQLSIKTRTLKSKSKILCMYQNNSK